MHYLAVTDRDIFPELDGWLVWLGRWILLLVGVSGGLEKRLSLEEMLEGEKLDSVEDEEAMESLFYASYRFGLVKCPSSLLYLHHKKVGYYLSQCLRSLVMLLNNITV
jgi:hypothetical protein